MVSGLRVPGPGLPPLHFRVRFRRAPAAALLVPAAHALPADAAQLAHARPEPVRAQRRGPVGPRGPAAAVPAAPRRALRGPVRPRSPGVPRLPAAPAQTRGGAPHRRPGGGLLPAQSRPVLPRGGVRGALRLRVKNCACAQNFVPLEQ